MYCHNCGRGNSVNARFCMQCGTPLQNVVIINNTPATNVDTNSRRKKSCPRCKGYNYHAFVEDVTLVRGKTKTQTSLNLNPLKPFTVLNHKEKVVRQPLTMKVSKFQCDDCGKIFQ